MTNELATVTPELLAPEGTLARDSQDLRDATGVLVTEVGRALSQLREATSVTMSEFLMALPRMGCRSGTQQVNDIANRAIARHYDITIADPPVTLADLAPTRPVHPRALLDALATEFDRGQP